MDAHDIEEHTGAVMPMNGYSLTGTVQSPVALTRLRNKLRDALEAIGIDLQSADIPGAAVPPHLILEIHQALSAFSELWRNYEIVLADHDNSSISAVGELTSSWLMSQLVDHVRKLEAEIADGEKPPMWPALLMGAMSATRWAARWSWLRYKQPPTRLWANAAYLHEVSEHWQENGDAAVIGNAFERCPTPRQEFSRLLFAQWVSPISLSVPAQLLLEQLFSEAKAQPTISPMPISPEDAPFDIGSGMIQLRRQSAPDASTHYISFGPLREEICQRVTQLALNDAVKAEPAKQLLRSVIGRRTRTLVRLGGRVELLRRVQACVGYYTIRSGLRKQDQRYAEGFVLDRSEEGCRIRFERLSSEANKLSVGALLQVKDVFDGEVCLGIVRWLKRVDPTGWELGVWLIRGTVHLRRMRTAQGIWPDGNPHQDVFLIDGHDRGSGTPTLAVLPKHSASPGLRLLGEDDSLRCEVLACVETGADFDVAVVADSHATE